VLSLDEIIPGLFVGPCPRTEGDVERLAAAGISAVLSLQTDEDLAEHQLDWPALSGTYRRREIEICRVPIRDFDPEALREHLPEAVAALQRLREAGHRVYVHCTAGMGRSPSVVVAFLHWVRDWDLEEAAEHVIQRRWCEPNLEAIRLATPAFVDEPDEAA